jgi:hypothetical protein
MRAGWDRPEASELHMHATDTSWFSAGTVTTTCCYIPLFCAVEPGDGCDQEDNPEGYNSLSLEKPTRKAIFYNHAAC